MTSKEKLDTVLKMLLSEDSSLVELARMTGGSIFRFYEMADLSGLDLSGQDLTGLNFSGANLTGSNLNNIRFNAGAFNGAKIDYIFSDMQDNYEFSLSECAGGLIQRVHMFARFRSGSIDFISETFQISFAKLAYLSLLSDNTIRNARYGKFLSMDSIAKLAGGVRRISGEVGDTSAEKLSSVFFRPMIEFSDVLPNGHRRYFRKEDVTRIVRMATLLHEQTGRYRDGTRSWRDSPTILAWLITGQNLIGRDDPELEAAAYDLRGIVQLTEDEINEILRAETVAFDNGT